MIHLWKFVFKSKAVNDSKLKGRGKAANETGGKPPAAKRATNGGTTRDGKKTQRKLDEFCLRCLFYHNITAKRLSNPWHFQIHGAHNNQ